MGRLSVREALVIAVLLLVSAGKRLAATGHHDLLSLVPPGARAVAKIGAQSHGLGNFVLITHNNNIDLNDFQALTGADSTCLIHELILVAAAGDRGAPDEHSLLADGNFDGERIFRSAVDGGAKITNYRGLHVLVVQPFARERREFNEIRWLAIPASGIVLFGSIVSVQQELDRYMARRETDPNLVARLARMRRDIDTWTVVSPLGWTAEIRSALASIEPRLADRLKDGDTLEFGIHFGREVEFEYEVTAASPAAAQTISESLTQSLAGLEEKAVFVLPAGTVVEGNTAHGVGKVSKGRYNAWLAKVSARRQARSVASP